MPRVLISAGHTIMDPGMIYQDLREADLTRKIAPLIIPHIQKAGIEVQGVPLDLQLFDRLDWINNTGYKDELGDICVEIHINDGGKRGLEAWYKSYGGNNSQKLAKVLTDTVAEDMKTEVQGVKSEHQHEYGALTFLSRSNPTSVLFETFFIDNLEDIAILKDDAKLNELAKSVARGILKYIGKDLEGKDLPEDQKPKFDDLKPYEPPAAPEGGQAGDFSLDDDLDMFGDMGTAPAGSTLPAPFPNPIPGPISAPTSPAAIPTPWTPPAMPMAGFGGMPNFPSVPGANPGSTGIMMDREQRKQLIEKTYIKILGRKPTEKDLNYFLNQGISEQDLVQKMIDSQEHVDIVNGKQELDDLKKKHSDLESEVNKLRASVNDQKNMIDNLSRLLAAKNQVISELERNVLVKLGVPSQVAMSQQQNQLQSEPGHSNAAKLRRGLKERILLFASKYLGK